MSHVSLMQDRLAKLVRENVSKVQQSQKKWYDRNTRLTGDSVLVLLPTSTSKLTAQWQGPYLVKRCIVKWTYKINMCDKQKRKRIFHVNMLVYAVKF